MWIQGGGRGPGQRSQLPSTAGTGWVMAPQGGLHVLEGPADPTLHCCGGWGGLGDGAFGARTVALGPECGAVSSLGSAPGGAWWLPDPSGAAQGPGLRSLVQCPRRGPWKGRDLGSPLPEALDSFFKQNQTQNQCVKWVKVLKWGHLTCSPAGVLGTSVAVQAQSRGELEHLGWAAPLWRADLTQAKLNSSSWAPWPPACHPLRAL